MQVRSSAWAKSVCCFGLALVLACGGCGRGSSEDSSGSSNAGTGGPGVMTEEVAGKDVEDPGDIEEAATLWGAGESEAAVRVFARIDWQKVAFFPRGSVFALTEQEYLGLSASERLTKDIEIDIQVGNLKGLVREVLQRGRQAAAVGDFSTARQYFSSARDCGKFLVEKPNGLELLKALGKGFVGAGERGLAGLGK